MPAVLFQNIETIKPELSTNTAATIDALIENGFSGSYDPEAREGIAYNYGLTFSFSTGAENFYFRIDTDTKDQPRETVALIAEFARALQNLR